MGKIRLLLALVGAVVVTAADPRSSTSAQGGVSTLPKLWIEDFGFAQAKGARMPMTASNGETFEAGAPFAISYDATSGTIYAANYKNSVAEMALPEMVNSTNINDLRELTFVTGQGFRDPIEGQDDEADGGGQIGASLGGLLVTPDRLYGTHTISYDSNNSQRRSHWSRPKNLSTTDDVKGLDQFWDGAGSDVSAPHTGLTSGYLFRVPSEWQPSFGNYQMGSGQCCQSIITRNSLGPAAGLFNPSLIGSGGTEPHEWRPLVYYSNSHRTLGCWDQDNPNYPGPGQPPRIGCQSEYFGYTTAIRGAVMINNTRTMAFFGRQGTGTPCYGAGTSNQALHGTEVDPITYPGVRYCYDPSSADTGNHQYPYVYFIWLYDINDLVRAFNGEIQPYDVRPYDGGEFTFPVAAPETGGRALVNIGGADYDAATRSLYLTQYNIDLRGDFGCCFYSSVLWRVPVDVPTSSGSVTSVDVSADKTSPQNVNTTITLSASAAGGTAPVQYKWRIFDGATWRVAASWSTSNQLMWTPTSYGTGYEVEAWARSAGSSADSAEASDVLAFSISGSGIANSISIAPDRAAPQPGGTPITWTSSVAGGEAPLQYKWWWWDGGASHDLTGWVNSPTLTWTPTWGNPNYAIGAWVRSSGNTSNTAEATSGYYPYPTSGPGPATAVSLSASHPSPQPVNTTITFTATPTGGVPQQQYKWFVLGATGWEVAREWSTDNTFGYTPTVAGSGHRVGVWVRSAGNTLDQAEATGGSEWYTIQ